MNPRHHLDPATIVSHAAGALSPEMAAVVATHLEGCGHCRQAVAQAEGIGGALIAIWMGIAHLVGSSVRAMSGVSEVTESATPMRWRRAMSAMRSRSCRYATLPGWCVPRGASTCRPPLIRR